jgi:pSer/pThr/pTyr-binding forkhead associated (FHA) protein
MWRLRAVDSNPAEPLVFRLLPGSMRTIGRTSGANFIVDAPLISRVHCRLTVARDGSIEVADLDSTNGTWVNGERIQTATLGEGNILRVGRVEFVLERD